MDDPQSKDFRSKATEQANDTLEKAIRQIETLAIATDPVCLFVATVTQLSFAPADSGREATHDDVPVKIETLAYILYPFFEVSGAEASKNSVITPWHINECLESLATIVTMRLMGRILSDRAATEPNDGNSVGTWARMHAEIVRGSAYPEQTGEEISAIQGHFDSWFITNVGISPNRAKDLLWAIVRRQEDAINFVMPDVRDRAKSARDHWRAIKKKSESERGADEIKVLELFENDKAAGVFGGIMALNLSAPDVIPVGLTDLSSLEPPPTCDEWEGLVKLIGMTSDVRAQMSAPVDARNRPLYVLPDHRVILVDISNGSDALWAAFEQLAKADQAFFDREYQRRRADWLEDKVVACLLSIFPKQSIYRNLSYPDPDKPVGSTAELDAAVLWGPFLILVESKAKQFRLESQLGDTRHLYDDIKANVEDAFGQARRAAKYIDNAAAPIFTEVSTGRQLAVQKDRIRRTYLVTVSLHHLAGLATRLSMFQDLGLFKDGEYPLSISVADLETVTRFCDGPDVFLHYIEKRLLTQKESLDIAADELDYWGAYLQTRLQSARLWNQDGVKPDLVSLVGFSAQFDEWFSYKRGDSTQIHHLAVGRSVWGLAAVLCRRK